MTTSNQFRTGRHCVFKLHCHLVFVTKYRYDVLQGYLFPTLEKLLAKVCQDFEAELMEFNGEADHVHLLLEYPPKVALSRLVNSLKGVSSRRLNCTIRKWLTDITSLRYGALVILWLVVEVRH